MENHSFTDLGNKLTRYRCIKCVSAAKITTLKTWPDGSVDIELENTDGSIASTRMDAGWNHKHSPDKGGYLVLYDNNYVSYSPADVFEKGHVEMTGNEGSEA